MDQIIIGFSTKKKFNLFSCLIKWFDDSNYSHVYLRKKSKYGEYVYQASGLSVNFMNIDTFLKSNDVVHEFVFDITEDDKYKILSFFIENAGRPYGMDQIFEISKILLLDKLGIPESKRKPINKNKKFICSELAAVILVDVLKKDLLEKEVLDLVTPKKLFTALQHHHLNQS